MTKMCNFENYAPRPLTAVSRFGVIYADPPWRYRDLGHIRRIDRQYRVMMPAKIVALPMQDIPHAFVERAQCHISFVVMPTAKKPVPPRVINIRLREPDLKRIDAIAKRERRAHAGLLQSWVLKGLANARSTK